MRVGYLVHDLNDAAVERRLEMLHRGGIDTVVAGFWRGKPPPARIAGSAAIPLGRTFDARLGHRALRTLACTLSAGALARALGAVDVLMARNLEMLAVAAAVRRQRPVPIVYEVLDIHRLLLARNPAGKLLRRLERHLMRNAGLLITSSPAFVREYFEPVHLSRRRVPVLLVENKPLLPPQADAAQSRPACGPPWRIGWFGMIRCKRSFEILSALAQRRSDLLRVIVRGRPAETELGDFAARVRCSPNVEFGGPYTKDALPALYNGVHFNWAIDYFEEGANSEWLLPNRLYEGGACNAIPMALARTETGRWLNARNLGVLMDDPAKDLEAFLDALDAEKFAALSRAAAAAPRCNFIADESDCRRLAAAVAAVANVQNRMSAETISCGVT